MMVPMPFPKAQCVATQVCMDQKPARTSVPLPLFLSAVCAEGAACHLLDPPLPRQRVEMRAPLPIKQPTHPCNHPPWSRCAPHTSFSRASEMSTLLFMGGRTDAGASPSTSAAKASLGSTAGPAPGACTLLAALLHAPLRQRAHARKTGVGHEEAPARSSTAGGICRQAASAVATTAAAAAAAVGSVCQRRECVHVPGTCAQGCERVRAYPVMF